MIQVHYTYCVLYFYYYYISFTSDPQTFDPKVWRPPTLKQCLLSSWMWFLFSIYKKKMWKSLSRVQLFVTPQTIHIHPLYYHFIPLNLASYVWFPFCYFFPIIDKNSIVYNETEANICLFHKHSDQPAFNADTSVISIKAQNSN